MSNSVVELEEIKTLILHQLASIVWPLRIPQDNASYVQEFASHIRTKFNEPSPNKYSRELNEFSNLRNIAVSTLAENSIRDNNSIEVLKKYYCQLNSILTRFRDCDATFPWKNSFGRSSNDGNLEFEMNNIMYNISSIHNEFGAKIAKTNDLSDKDALLHFSNALWWVKELRDNRSGLKPKEMGHDLLTFFYHILQAQAQECVLNKMIRSGMKPDLVAKICAQIASDYNIASKLAQTPLYTDPLKEIMSGASIFQNWRATVDFKFNYYSSMTQVLLGLACSDEDAKGMGFRIARLRWANQFLEPCRKLISDTLDSQRTRLAFDSLSNFVIKKLDKANRYNDNVYHSTIPSREVLPVAECKLLISPIAFQDPGYRDLFSDLITIESVQGSSLYSQMKDDLSRNIKTEVEKQDEELAHLMSSLNFDKRSLKCHHYQRLTS